MNRTTITMTLLLAATLSSAAEVPAGNRPDQVPGLTMSVSGRLLEWEVLFVELAVTNRNAEEVRLVDPGAMRVGYALLATIVGETTAGRGEQCAWPLGNGQQSVMTAPGPREEMFLLYPPGLQRRRTCALRPMTVTYLGDLVRSENDRWHQYNFAPETLFATGTLWWPVEENPKAKRRFGDTSFGVPVTLLSWELDRCYYEDAGSRHAQLSPMIRYDVAVLTSAESRFLVVGVRRNDIIGERIGAWPRVLRLAELPAGAQVHAVPPWAVRYHEDGRGLPHHHFCFAWVEEREGSFLLRWRYRVTGSDYLYPFRSGDAFLNAKPLNVTLGFDEEKKIFFATCEGLDPARIDLVAEVPDHDPAAVVEETVAVAP